MPVSIETVCTDRFRMRFFRFGRGKKDLLILPGLSVQSVMGFADAVAKAYERLQDGFTVYLLDRREEPPADYPVAEMARDTLAALAELGLRQFDLFGASQGGMIAMLIAIEQPALVRRLALGSTSPYLRAAQQAVVEEWIRLAKANDPLGLYLDFGARIYPPAFFAQCREQLMAAAKTVTEAELARFVRLAEGMRGFDVTDRLAQIQCPVLAIGDRDDAVLGPEATAAIAEKLSARPDFTCCMYSGCGHAAFDTAPDYKERLYRFFTLESSAAAPGPQTTEEMQK